MVFLLIIALVVLGPEKLPDAVRKFGKFYGEFKKMSTGFQSELRNALDEPMREMRETADAVRQAASFDFEPTVVDGDSGQAGDGVAARRQHGDARRTAGTPVSPAAVEPAPTDDSGATPPHEAALHGRSQATEAEDARRRDDADGAPRRAARRASCAACSRWCSGSS